MRLTVGDYDMKPMLLRDDFPKPIKVLLSRRVGHLCSNPICRVLTSGPHRDPQKAVSIGVAAHITAAAPGGPRFDPRLTSEERRSARNGIWLCQNCAKRVDSDELKYTAQMLLGWRERAEELAEEEIAARSKPKPHSNDTELLRFFCQCLDRPAFQDGFQQEGNMEAFDKAIEDTITALNTGCSRDRQGNLLQQARGKAFLSNHDWRLRIDTVVDLLRALRARYQVALQKQELVTDNHGDRPWYCIYEPALEIWMDSTRAEILGIMNGLCTEAGIPSVFLFPRPHRPLPGRW